MSIPDWLQRHLTSIGRWDADGVRRTVSATVCRCGARVLRGLDDDTCALAATVEPDPIDTAGELLALLQKRRTFKLGYYGRWELDRRSSIDISAQPAGVVDVLVEHRCNQPFPCNGPPIIPPQKAHVEMQEEACPF